MITLGSSSDLHEKIRADLQFHPPITVPEFDDEAARTEYLGPMPRYDEYQAKYAELGQQKKTAFAKFETDQSAMRPCYVTPLLDRDQEDHLLRKMHLLRHMADRALDYDVDQASTYFYEAKSIQKFIIEANCRLVPAVLRKRFQGTPYRDELLSEGYEAVLYACRAFDWTRGNRFCTYATHAIYRRMCKETKALDKQRFRYRNIVSLGVDDDENEGLEVALAAGDDGYSEERRVAEIRRLATNIIKDSPLTKREKYILICRNHGGRKLDDLAAELKITRQRVQQIQARGMQKLQAWRRPYLVAYKAIA